MLDRGYTAPALIVVLGIIALYPLFGSKLLLGHDAERYVPRVVEFHECVRHVQLPPVWAANLSRGHGQPLFEFAPPFLYALGEPLYAAGLGVARAIQWPVAVLTLLAAMALGELAARLTDDPNKSHARLLAATAVLFAPFTQVELYVRAAYAEAAAMTLVPIALLITHTAVTRPSARAVAILAVAIAALPATHFPMALLGVGFVTLFGVVLASESEKPRQAILCLGVGTVLGLGLSAFAWLPALLESQHIQLALLRGSGHDYRDHFVAPAQLLWTAWGFGLSVAGVDDGMPLLLGPGLLLAAACGLTVVWRRRYRRRIAVTCGVVAVAAMLMSTSWSSGLWTHLTFLHYFGYPWRFHALSTIALSLLAGLAASHGRRFTLAMIVLLVVPSVRHVGAWSSRVVAAAESNPESIAARGVQTSLLDEYEPVTAGRDLPYSPLHFAASPAIDVVQPVLLTPHRRVFDVTLNAPSRLVSRTYDYPGWTARVDGVVVATAHESDTGLITLDAPVGHHQVELELMPTPVRRASSRCSMIAAMLVTALLFMRTGAAVADSGERS